MNKKIMILAAGRGERLRPMTDTLPKALIEVGGKPLIIHHIERCAACGYFDLIINLAHLGEKIKDTLGTGARWGVNITYSHEQGPGLETGGGIINALPLLGDKPFITINADVFTDYDLRQLPTLNYPHQLAHLVLVQNPKHNRYGDFGLNKQIILNNALPTYTFSGIASYHPKFFNEQSPTRQSIVPLLRKQAEKALISGEIYAGVWHDIGTPERLQSINHQQALKP